MKKRLNRGMSMCEVLIASAVAMLAFGGFLANFVNATWLLHVAPLHHQAGCIGRNRIQEGRTVAFGALEFLDETATQVDDRGETNSQGKFFRTTRVSPGVGPFSKKMHVEVSFYIKDKQCPSNVAMNSMISMID